MGSKISRSSYYDYRRIDAYNGAWNFILGGRGIGKTYGGIKKEIKAGIKTGSEFMYVRRTEEEIKIVKSSFFDAVAHEFPEAEFRINGVRGEWAPMLPNDYDDMSTKEKKKVLADREWRTIVHFAALSTSQKLKSKPFPRVNKIIYDEIILEKGATQYLPNEVRAMLNLYNTVDRQGDRVKVYFLANAVSIENPYFIAYNISPDDVRREFVVKADGFIVCHFPDSDAFKREVEKTRFGKFLKDFNPDYFDYAHANSFSDNHKDLIGPMDPKSSYLYTLETEKGTFAVFNRLGSATFYCRKKRPRNDEVFYTMVPSRVTPDRLYVEAREPMLYYLRAAWTRGEVVFDAPATRNAFIHIFQK